MSGQKIHVAGEPKGDVQRCTRCHTKLHDRARWKYSDGSHMATSFWRVGAQLRAMRESLGVASERELATIRKCGRRVE